MDFAQVARELEIEESEYRMLLMRFSELTKRDLSLLDRAFDESNTSAAHAAAHSIKGASASLSLWSIYEPAATICESAQSGSMTSVPAMTAQIRVQLDLLSLSLKGATGDTPHDA